MLERSFDHVRDPLNVAMGMHRPRHTRHQSVVVEHTQRTELHPFGVHVVVEAEVPAGVEPPALLLVDLRVTSCLDHRSSWLAPTPAWPHPARPPAGSPRPGQASPTRTGPARTRGSTR